MAGGHVWWGVWHAPPGRYYEIQSISGQYTSYWNAFLFILFYYRPQTKFGTGNIFTPMCHTVHRGVLHPGGRGSASRRGSASWGVCLQGGWAGPLLRILRDTVNDRAVRILLKVILVQQIITPCKIIMQGTIHNGKLVNNTPA